MAGKERPLVATPTWAVAVLFFILIAISILIEQLIHHLGSWLKKKRKPSLFEALDKIKAELMLLGFISLLLTVTQDDIAKICVPRSVGHSWHPCRNYEGDDDNYDDPCLKKGQVQFVSAYGMHQLHIFIFVLAVAHILYCVITYGLGRLKMRKWKSWENETKTIQYQYYNDPERFRFARDTSFGRRHLHFWSKSPLLLWIAHLTPNSQQSFDFHKYINRSLEEDFKVVVGISPVIWLCAVLILLTNTNGAKLQVIITKMGIRILERGDVIKGTPVVQPGDDLFWFNRPGLILFLIHLVLFQNAFQLAFFAWSWWKFGYPSCYHENLEDLVIRIAMGVLVQVLCSYVTLPLYALVTQMGTNMKPVIFSNQVASALRGWHQTAKKQLRQGQRSANTTPFSSRPASPLHGSMSPVYLLRGHKEYSDNNVVSPRASNFCNEGWGGEGASAPVHDHDIDDFMRNGMNNTEIERDIEKPTQLGDRGQHEIQISMSDFSFRQKGSVDVGRAGSSS
ncbi:UNVERIFIED_CONTAM: MLO-like protein 6 [Sesamum latifolium]|uniref:MLO-like protein n=1 Tax=Sesamum latifolium TaxID=2727402 RepID=A0AAW2TCU6_9LAMI